MTGKQATVGWLGVGLIVANVVSGVLRPVLTLISSGGSHGGDLTVPGLGKVPNPTNPWNLLPGPGHPIPGVPKLPSKLHPGPLTGIPYSPISYRPPTSPNPSAVPGVWA